MTGSPTNIFSLSCILTTKKKEERKIMRRILFSKVTKYATDRNKYENKHEIHGNYTHTHTHTHTSKPW